MSKVTRLLQKCLGGYATARGDALTAEEAQAVLDQLAPVAEAAIRYQKATDSLIKTSRAKEKAMRKAAKKTIKRAENQHREQVTKMQNGYKRPLSDLGYANGHRIAPAYSAYPVWHGKSGRGHGKPAEN